MLQVSPRSGRQHKAHGESANRRYAATHTKQARAAGDSALLVHKRTNLVAHSSNLIFHTYPTEQSLETGSESYLAQEAVARCWARELGELTQGSRTRPGLMQSPARGS